MQTLEKLEKFAQQGRIAFREDAVAPVAILVAPGGSAEVSLYGANVLSYRPTGHSPVLWLADSYKVVEPGSPTRGGIPVCWPWFGAGVSTVTVSGVNEDTVMDCCYYIREFLRSVCDERDEILGPAPLPVVRVNNRYRYRITVYTANSAPTRRAITDIVMHCAKDRNFKDVNVFADVDPYD